MDTALVINKGPDQLIQLPRSFHFNGDKVYIKRMGNAIVLTPQEDSWNGLLETLDMFTEDFMEDRNQPLHQERPELDDLFEGPK